MNRKYDLKKILSRLKFFNVLQNCVRNFMEKSDKYVGEKEKKAFHFALHF